MAFQVRAVEPLDDPLLGLRVHGSVYAVARQSDGSVILGGNFTRVDGEFRYNLARLRVDGSLDPDWRASTDRSVYELAVDDMGRIYIGGSFSVVGPGPVVRRHVARLNADGTLDAAWDPSPNDEVTTIQISGNGKLYIGGRFRYVGGVAQEYVARLHANGAVDTAWAPDVDFWVHRLLLDGDNIYLGGAFDTVNGLVRKHVARLSSLGSGAVDPAWHPSPNGTVDALARIGAHLYIGGSFTTFDGVPHRNLARVDASGTLDRAWAPDPDRSVNTLSFDGNGRVYVGGWFTRMRGQSFPFLARVPLSGTGAPDATFVPAPDGAVFAVIPDEADIYVGGLFGRVGTTSTLGMARLDLAGTVDDAVDASNDGRVTVVLPIPGGGTYVGGYFDKAGGLPRKNLLRLNPDRTLDAGWSADADSDVHALALAPDRSLYVGGGSTANPTWGYVKKLHADGTLSSWTTSIDGAALALAVDTDGAVFVGGEFGTAGGAVRGSIAKLSGTSGQADALWRSDVDGVVHAVALSATGHLYIGGDFETVGTDIGNLARVSARGSAAIDAQWRPRAGTVRALALDDGAGQLYVGGYFDTLGGVARANIGKISASGPAVVDQTWNPGADGEVRALALDSDGGLFAGGDFIEMDDRYADRVARLEADGRIDPRWFLGRSATVSALAIDSADPSVLFVGGRFIEYDALEAGLVAVRARGTPRTNVGVHLSQPRSTTRPGARLRYDITVDSSGLDPDVGSLLRLNLPAGLTDAQWRCLANESTAACPEGTNSSGVGSLFSRFDLGVGSILRFEWSAIVNAPGGTSVTARATVSSPNSYDVDLDNNRSEASTLVDATLIFFDEFERD
nr:hypothetical protein [Chiayiivirga flava]